MKECSGCVGVMRPDLAQYLAKGGLDKESAIYKAAARIQSRYRGYAVQKVPLLLRLLSATLHATLATMLPVRRRYHVLQ